MWIDNDDRFAFRTSTDTGGTWLAWKQVADTSMTNPIGAIIMFNGAFANIPANWQLCDGTNGTPDMLDRFVMGTNTEGTVGTLGGSNNAVAVNHAHSDTFSISSTGSNHVHHWNGYYSNDGSGYDSRARWHVSGDPTEPCTNDDGEHTHGIDGGVSDYTGNDGIGDNRPLYVQLAYIQRMS